MTRKRSTPPSHENKEVRSGDASLYKALDKIKDLPALPQTAISINKMMEDPNSTIEKICQTIEKDQAITLKTLKLANSAFYGLRENVCSISDAVILLGLSTLKNIATSISIITSFPQGKNVSTFSMTDFWRHAVTVAVISRKLTEIFQKENADICFLSGLLHDIGKLVLLNKFRPYFEEILLRIETEEMSFFDAEKKTATHAHIGAYLIQKWHLPAAVAEIIRYHHTPHQSTNYTRLATIIHAADILSYPETGSPAPLPPADVFLDRISLFNFSAASNTLVPPEFTIEWYEEIHDSVLEACDIFLDKNS